MKHSWTALLLTVCMLSACKAELRELCYDHSHGEESAIVLQLELNLDLDLDVEVDIESHTVIEPPEYMKLGFYSPQGGGLLNTEYVEAEGGPLHTPAGTYQMVAYSFGTEWTQVRGEGDINTLEAFTSDITRTKAAALAGFTRNGGDEPEGPIIYTPDHLLVARKQIEIPHLTAGTHSVTIKAEAATILETYGFEVNNVTGLEYIASAEAFVTNQARSSFFGRGEVSTDPATISFPVEVDRAKGHIHTTFNTFGKLPGESHSYLHILILDTDGKEYHISTDITDQFEKPDHHIIIEEEVDIPKPQGPGGGIAPTVDQWEEVENDVNIG